MSFNPEKLAAFRKSAPDSRTGGAGSMRRKFKVVRKAAVKDDSKLFKELSRFNVRDIPAIEEVNLFHTGGMVTHFRQPRVQASLAANTYVVSGDSETKHVGDLLPGILSQLGPDNIDALRALTERMGGLRGAAAGAGNDLPDLVDNFEAGADDVDDVPDLVESSA